MKKILVPLVILALALSCKERQEAPQWQNPALDNIFTRVSVRDYTSQKVEADKVDLMLRAGMAAPTARNTQPWHFLVVDDRAVLDAFAAVNFNKPKIDKCALAIVPCGDLSKAMEGVEQEFWVQDVSAATENILLAAHALGLGAVWTGLYPRQERVEDASRVFGLPEYIVPLCAILIGYPAEQPAVKEKWNPLNVSYNQFGQGR